MKNLHHVAVLLNVLLATTAVVYCQNSGATIAQPAIKLYQVDDRNKIVKTLGDIPDSAVIIESVERIRLDCESSYPVQWIYTGTGVPVLLSNIRKESDDKYTASAFINSLKEHHTGNYACVSTEFPTTISSYFHIFVPGPLLFTMNSVGNTVYIPKNDSHILIPCATSNPNAVITLEKASGGKILSLEVDNVNVIYEPRRGFRVDLAKIENPEGEYLCKAKYGGLVRFVEYFLAYSTSGDKSHSVANIEHTTAKAADDDDGSLKHCTTHTDCPPNFSCYTDLTCKDPCLNSIRCGTGAICKYNDRRPYCECPADFVGDAMKECFNTLQGSDTSPAHSTTRRPSYNDRERSCRRNQDCENYEKCIKDQCTDPCKTRLCGRNAECITENHITSCHCNSGYYGDANSVIGCAPQKYSRPDPLKEKESVDDSFINCQTNRDCPADQICRTHVGSLRVCVQVCGAKICGVNSECHQGSSTSDQPSCLCRQDYTGHPSLGCEKVSSSTDCAVDNDCKSEEKCERGKCVHLCSKQACPFNLECEAFDHEVRCICPAGFTGSEQIGCTRDVSFTPDFYGRAQEAHPDTESLVCSSLSCGPFSECRIEGGQPKCYCQSGYKGSPPRCRQECETTSDCPATKSCVQKRCRNVCRNRCAPNATCRVRDAGTERIPVCVCNTGFTGNAEVECSRL